MQVRNQRTLDTLYHTLYADEIKMMEEAEHEESLYHHGVEGMSWGDRNCPPYPLGGGDKKVARAEYKAKKEKERRLKKLQKAAKKARKVKAKNAKQEAEILKKKQKLVKEGNLDKIRKNANLFTNEELQYVIERDAQKRALGSRDERSADEKFELAMKRMAQIGDIAANAGKVLSAAKIGADILTSVKTAKVKDLEMEDKRLSAIKTEWEMRFKGREDTPESRQFINDAVNNQQYKPSKAEKKVDKAANKKRIEELKESPLDKKERELYEKARKEDLRNANKQLNQQIKDRKKSERDEFLGKFKKDKDGSDDQQKKTDKSIKDFAKGLDVDEAWQKIKKDTAAQQEAKRQFGELNNGWESKPYKDTVKTSYTADGSSWAESFLSSGKSWDTYTAQKGWQVTPRKKVVATNRTETGNVSGRNTEPVSERTPDERAQRIAAIRSGVVVGARANGRDYTLPSSRTSWSSKPAQKIESERETSSGRSYVLSGKDKWSSKPVSSLPKTPIWASLDIDAQLSGKYGGIAPVKIGIASRSRGKAREAALYRETRMRNIQNKMESAFAPKKTERTSYSGAGSSYAKLQSEARRLASDYAYYTEVARRAGKSIGSVMPPELNNRLWDITMEKGPVANALFDKYYHKFSPYA